MHAKICNSMRTHYAYMQGKFNLSYNPILFDLYNEKRFYTRGTLREIRVPDWQKSLNFNINGWDPWIKKRVNYLSCIEGKSMKDIDCIAQNAALFVSLF